jgi:hypothetical protein
VLASKLVTCSASSIEDQQERSICGSTARLLLAVHGNIISIIPKKVSCHRPCYTTRRKYDMCSSLVFSLAVTMSRIPEQILAQTAAEHVSEDIQKILVITVLSKIMGIKPVSWGSFYVARNLSESLWKRGDAPHSCSFKIAQCSVFLLQASKHVKFCLCKVLHCPFV